MRFVKAKAYWRLISQMPYQKMAPRSKLKGWLEVIGPKVRRVTSVATELETKSWVRILTCSTRKIFCLILILLLFYVTVSFVSYCFLEWGPEQQKGLSWVLLVRLNSFSIPAVKTNRTHKGASQGFWFGTIDDPPPRLLGVMWDAPSSTAKSTAPIGAPNAALTPAAAPAATKSRVSTFATFALQIARNSEYLRAITFSQHPHLTPALTESLIEGSHLQS